MRDYLNDLVSNGNKYEFDIYHALTLEFFCSCFEESFLMDLEDEEEHKNIVLGVDLGNGFEPKECVSAYLVTKLVKGGVDIDTHLSCTLYSYDSYDLEAIKKQVEHLEAAANINVMQQLV